MKNRYWKLTLWLGSVAIFAAFSSASIAEDIDLYAGVTGTTGGPNVLFFMDNTSNWSNNAQKWTKASVDAKCNLLDNVTLLPPDKTTTKRAACLSYSNQIFNGAADLLQGQIELRALRLVLNELVCATGKYKVNAGLMLLNDQGTVDSSSNSGYIRHRIAPLDTTHCATFLGGLGEIDQKITEPEFKGPSSAEYGAALYEAFKYFGGWTNPAGAKTATAGTPVGPTGFGPERYSKKMEITKGQVTNVLEDPLAFTNDQRTTYRSPLVGDALCGKNYIVLIGNKFPNQEWGTDVNATPYPTNTLMTRLGYNPGAQIFPKPFRNSDKSDVRFADEWAAFLNQTDVSDAPDIQDIRMFTVDVFNASGDAKQKRLLESMAAQSGGGGYFSVGGDLYELINAFESILTQIAAVNSVFASASLPVSVNAQGTFLNQVFMGVFRPDAGAQQRWVGNLKQYQFWLDGNKELYLADQAKLNAVDSQNTGFIQNCATSFWTTDSGEYWKTVKGFNESSSCPTSAYSGFSDAPDGPIVERGGAGQRLRTLGHASRNIRTCASSPCAALTDFDTTTMSGKMADPLVQWLRGENNGDGYLSVTGDASVESYSLGATATRPTVHGDVVHSRPLAVNYGVTDNSTTPPTETPDVVVFYGAGDGMLRAVSGGQTSSDGNELWSFVAPEHWSTLDRVRTNSPLVAYPSIVGNVTGPTPKPRSWYFDGAIGGYQERTSTAVSKLWIYPTMRRGGRSVYAFDVSKKPGKTATTTTDQPKLLWRYGPGTDTTADAKMGESWSLPIAIRVKGIAAPLVVFGAGYDSCEDDEDPVAKCAPSGVTIEKGRGVVVLDAEKGTSVAANYRFIGVASGELDTSAGRFVADIAPVDINNDGYVDVLYAVDTRGNIWRINTSNPNPSTGSPYDGYTNGVADWKVSKVGVVSDWSVPAEKRKLMNAPSTVKLGNQVTVLVGSGDREKPSATSNASKVENRFYGIRDDVSVTTSVPLAIGYGPESSIPIPSGKNNLKNVTNSTSFDPTLLNDPLRGWYLNLSSASEPYEQVVTTPLTLAGVTYFSTYQAKAPSASANACTNLGTARGYQVDFQTGTQVGNLPVATEFLSQGMPPSPVGGVVMVDGKPVPFVIGGPGKTPITPKKVVPIVRPDRKPVFRTIRIDK